MSTKRSRDVPDQPRGSGDEQRGLPPRSEPSPAATQSRSRERLGSRPPPSGKFQTRVRFIENSGELTVLEIESSPQHPLSYSLPSTLGDLGLRIVQRETRMRAQRSVQRVQVSELDGSAVSQQRRFQLQSALVTSAGQTPLPPLLPDQEH